MNNQFLRTLLNFSWNFMLDFLYFAQKLTHLAQNFIKKVGCDKWRKIRLHIENIIEFSLSFVCVREREREKKIALNFFFIQDRNFTLT